MQKHMAHDLDKCCKDLETQYKYFGPIEKSLESLELRDQVSTGHVLPQKGLHDQ